MLESHTQSFQCRHRGFPYWHGASGTGDWDARNCCSGADVGLLRPARCLRHKAVHHRYSCQLLWWSPYERRPGNHDPSGDIQTWVSRRSSHGYKLSTQGKSSFWNCPCAIDDGGPACMRFKGNPPYPATSRPFVMRKVSRKKRKELSSRIKSPRSFPITLFLPQLLVT